VNLGPRQIRVLRALGRGRATASLLARVTGCTGPQAASTLASLRARGLVQVDGLAPNGRGRPAPVYGCTRAGRGLAGQGLGPTSTRLLSLLADWGARTARQAAGELRCSSDQVRGALAVLREHGLVERDDRRPCRWSATDAGLLEADRVQVAETPWVPA
jgi:predicted ArsR family transcriptional regulator